MEGWVKKIRNMTVGAAALGAVAAESSKVEAGFVPVKVVKMCVLETAKNFEYDLEGQNFEVPIPQAGDPTEGELPDGWKWEYFEKDGLKKFKLKNPDLGPGYTEVTIECQAIS